MEWFYWFSWAQIWLIVGLCLISIDIILPSGGLLSAAGLTVLCAALLAWFHVPWWVYLLVLPPMAVVSIALCLWLLAKGGGLLERFFLPDTIKTNIDALPGSMGVIKQVRDDGLVYIEVLGDRWLGMPEGDTPLPPKGSKVTVVRVENGRLVVR